MAVANSDRTTKLRMSANAMLFGDNGNLRLFFSPFGEYDSRFAEAIIATCDFEAAIVAGIVESDSHAISGISLFLKKYFKSAHGLLVVHGKRPLVHQQANVAYAVDVPIEIDVGILKSVTAFFVVGNCTDFRQFVDGANLVAYVFTDVLQRRNVLAFSCGKVDYYPNSPCIANQIAFGIGYFEIAF